MLVPPIKNSIKIPLRERDTFNKWYQNYIVTCIITGISLVVQHYFLQIFVDFP